MSQFDFGIIDPFVDGGVTLASDLNQWRNALYSMHRGATRPTYVVPGMVWCNDAAGPSNWIVNYYVGTTIGDVALFNINTTTGAITWRATILGGPFLPLAGGAVSGPTSFADTLSSLAALMTDSIAGRPTHIFRAQGNAVNSRIFEFLEQPDGSFSIRAVTDDLSTVQGEVKVQRDGQLAATAPLTTAAAGEVVTASWVRALVAATAAGAPTGMLAPFAGGGSAPAGWLLCAGQVVPRTTYAALFAVIGTGYNSGGEAGTDFRLPDLRGRTVFGADAMLGVAANRLGGGGARAGGIASGTAGSTGGEQAHTLIASEGPNGLGVNITGGTVRGSYIGGGGPNPSIPETGGAPGVGVDQTFMTLTGGSGVTTGGGGSHNTVPPGIVLNYIIKT
jgi:microcystin-dependent protein